MDLRLHACRGCPITISNRVENRNWLVLVSLTRWRTNRKIMSVSNRPVSRCPMSQGIPISLGLAVVAYLPGSRKDIYHYIFSMHI